MSTTANDANATANVKPVVTLDRRREERRSGNAEALDSGMMKQPRRKANRRRHIDPTTCERDYSDCEVEFMRAMDDYKRRAGRMFPTCSEVLEVIRELGYRQLTDDQIVALGLDEVEIGDEGSAEAELREDDNDSVDDVEV
ncbi:MAG: hypothetical protein AAF958_00545 [Planctomycetota bacterium]